MSLKYLESEDTMHLASQVRPYHRLRGLAEVHPDGRVEAMLLRRIASSGLVKSAQKPESETEEHLSFTSRGEAKIALRVLENHDISPLITALVPALSDELARLIDYSVDA